MPQPNTARRFLLRRSASPPICFHILDTDGVEVLTVAQHEPTPGTPIHLIDADGRTAALLTQRTTSKSLAVDIDRPGFPTAVVEGSLTHTHPSRWSVLAGDVGELRLLGDLHDKQIIIQRRDRTVAELTTQHTGEHTATILGDLDHILALAAIVTIDQILSRYLTNRPSPAALRSAEGAPSAEPCPQQHHDYAHQACDRQPTPES